MNTFQGEYFGIEYFSGVNIFQGEYFSEVNILQGWPFFRGSCSPPKFVQAEFRTVERCLVIKTINLNSKPIVKFILHILPQDQPHGQLPTTDIMKDTMTDQ